MVNRWLAAAATFALVTRLLQYASNRSLWYDEVLLAWNVRLRDFIGLAQPLDNGQGAPIGFLWATKSLTLLWGDSEWVLRLLPLLASLASVLLLWRMATRWFSPQTAFAALLMFATSSALIYYAAEFKQYALDVCAALLITHAALAAYHTPDVYHLRRLALLGVVAVWFSHPAVFVLAGVGLALLWQTCAQPMRRAVWAMVSAWVTSFAVVYLAFYRPLSQHQHLNAFWSGGFIRLDTPITWALAIFEPFFYLANVGQLGLAGFAFVAFVLGVWHMRSAYRALLLLPVLVTVGASLLQLYPFSERLILFLQPAYVLTTALGCASVAARVGSASKRAAQAITLAFVAVMLVRTPYVMTKQEVRDFLAKLPNDTPLYADLFVLPIANYYVEGIAQPAETLTADAMPSWVLFVTRGVYFEPYTRPLHAHLDSFAAPAQELVGDGVRAVLYTAK